VVEERPGRRKRRVVRQRRCDPAEASVLPTHPIRAARERVADRYAENRRCDRVDFRQPSPHGFKAIPAGAPFFFRLDAPHKAIAGFGFFARYERVPVWLAWESFGDLNGTDTFAEMTARIEAIRRRTGSALLARPRDYEVGCIMISQPVFFAHDDWVADHADWQLRIQGGKTIEIAPFLPAAMSTWGGLPLRSTAA
jgi:hypothetical protein